MHFPRFFHRDTESLREGRLIFQQMSQSPEAPRGRPQTVLERLTDEHANEADLEKAVAELPEESDVYRAVVAEGQKLDIKQRQIVGANLQRLSARIEQRAKTQVDQLQVLAKVERMRSALSVSPEAHPTEPATPAEAAPSPEAATNVPVTPAPVQPEQGFLARGWEQAGKYWDEALPEVKAISVGAATALVAYGAYRFVRWLWGGTKQAAEATVEKAKSGWNWLKTTLVLGGIGLLGYFGFKIGKRYLLGEIGAMVDTVHKTLASAEARLKQVNGLLEKGKDLTHDEMTRLQEEKRALEQRVREFREGRSKKNKPENEAAPAPNEGTEAPPPLTEDQRKKLEQAAESTGQALVAKGLLSVYPPPAELGTLHFSEVNDFLRSIEQQKVGQMLQGVRFSPAGAFDFAATTLPEGTVRESDRERREAAARYIVWVLWTGKKELLQLRKDLTPEAVDGMDIREFLQAFAQGVEAVGSIAEAVLKAEGNTAKLKELLDLKKLVAQSGAVKIELKEIAQECKAKGKKLVDRVDDPAFLNTVVELTHTLGDSSMSVRQFLHEYRSNTGKGEVEPSRELIAHICAALEDDDTAKAMLPFFHQLFPDRSWSDKEDENLAHVREILLDRMTVAQATRIYLYKRMLKKGNPAGLLLMQSEIFWYVSHHDEGFLRDKGHQMLLTIGELCVGKGWEEWQKSCNFEIPPEVLERFKQALSLLGGMAVKGVVASVWISVRNVLGLVTASVKKHPAGTIGTAVGGTGAALAIGKNLTDRAIRFSSLETTLKEEAASTHWLDRLKRRVLLRPGTEVFTDASNKVVRLNKIVMEELSPALRAEVQAEYNRALQSLDTETAWQNFRRFVTQKRASLSPTDPSRKLLGEIGDVAKEISQDRGLRKAIRIGVRRPNVAKILPTKLLNTTPVDRGAFALNRLRRSAGLLAQRGGRAWMDSWRAASPLGRAAYVGGVGLHGLALYSDYREIGEIREQREQAHTYATETINTLIRDMDGNPQFERLEYGRYRHKASGVEVSLQGVNTVIDQSIGQVFDDRELAQKLRTGTTAAALAATLLMGAKAFTGPAGLIVVGVEITIRTGINAWEQNKMRTFLKDAPPWLLSALGTQKTTGEGEYDWLEKASSWMISDLRLNTSFATDQKEKAELQRRMVYSMFVRELNTHEPEVLREIVGGTWSPALLDQFYREDFQSFVLPAFSVCLFQSMRDGGVSWENVRQTDITTGLVILPERITLMEIREAIRKSSILYMQHLRERRYDEYRRLQAGLPADDPRKEALDELIEAMGINVVFGRALADSRPEDLARNGGKTRAEKILGLLLAQCASAPGSTRDAKTRESNIFAVPASSVAGLAADFNLADREGFYGLVDDPVVRLKLMQLTPQTLGEEEAQKRQRWNDWSLSRLTHLPSAVDQMEAFLYSAPFHTANMIAEKLGEPSVYKNTSILDILGRSRDAASYDAARTFITEGLDRLCSRGPSADGALRRAPSYDALYGENGPLVFVRGNGHPDRRLARLIRYPETNIAGFEARRLQAVLLERQDLGGDHSGLLATYIFGDLESGKVSVLQRGAGTFLLAHMPASSLIDGLDRPLALEEFLARPGAETLLQEARNAIAQRKAKAAEEARLRAQQRLAEEQTAGDTWKKDAPQRAETIEAQRRLRAGAWERVRSGAVVGFVPGEYTEDTASHRLTLSPGSFRGHFGTADVEIDDISTADAVSSADPEIEPTPFHFRAQRDGKSWNFHVTMNNLREEPTPDFTHEDQQLARDVLVTPMNLAGHPRAGDAHFVEQVRREELHRVLRMAQYRGGSGWTGREYLVHLQQELWPFYRDAQGKTVFLNTLLNNLMTERVITGGAFDSPYRRILSNMKHEW